MIKLKSKRSATVDDVLKKSVITEGFEQLPQVPLNNKNQRLAKKERRVRSFFYLEFAPKKWHI